MDSFDVFYRERPVGKVTMHRSAGGVRFDAVCTLSGDAVLRLYGRRGERVLMIGVLAPHAGYWHIGRTVSHQQLRESGFSGDLPDTFLLSEQMPEICLTGDPLLDEALRQNTVRLSTSSGGREVSCPFDPQAPSPLAFALTACTVRSGRAILRIDN